MYLVLSLSLNFSSFLLFFQNWSFLKIMHLVFKSSLILFVALGALSLIACGESEQATNTSDAPETVSTIDEEHEHSHDEHYDENAENAQVIVSGIYHLEFIAEPKDDGTNLNFHLENEESHQPIPDAKVAARVQLPNGDEKILDLQYEAERERYVAFLPEQAKGEYKVTILTETNGEQVNSSFSFDK